MHASAHVCGAITKNEKNGHLWCPVEQTQIWESQIGPEHVYCTRGANAIKLSQETPVRMDTLSGWILVS